MGGLASAIFSQITHSEVVLQKSGNASTIAPLTQVLELRELFRKGQINTFKTICNLRFKKRL